MKNKTTYEEMMESAKLIPQGRNIKMILRHSYRKTLKGVENPNDVSLTLDGINLAYTFGKDIKFKIGTIYCSKALRCRETVKYILLGTTNKNLPINIVDMSSFYAKNTKLANATFKAEGNGKCVIEKMSNNITLPGLYSINECAKKQIKFIFESGGSPSKVDIFCTHDFQIMCLISALFKNIHNMDDVRSNWPNMLEGLLIWGTLDNFYCIWRNQICNIINLNI